MRQKKTAVARQVLGMSALNALLLLYYFYMAGNGSSSFWEMLLGGIGIVESRNILFIVIFILPDFLFYFCARARCIRQLKENYVYIFVRERDMKVWVRKYAAASLLEMLLYKLATVIMLCAIGSALGVRTGIAPDTAVLLILAQFSRSAGIMLFCDLILLGFNELAAVYVNLFLQALPLFAVGVLYDLEGPWEMAVKCLPPNWCNYNYLVGAGIRPWPMLGLSAALGTAIYFCTEKTFKNYEAV